MSLSQYEDFVFRCRVAAPGRSGGAWKDFSRKLHEIVGQAGGRPRAAGGRRGHRHHGGRCRPHLDRRRRRPQLPRRRGVHRARRRRVTRGDVRVLVPRHLRRPRGGRRAAAVRGRPGGQDPRRPRPGAAARDAVGRRRRVGAGRVRDRHQLQRRPVTRSRSCSTRRSAARSTWRSAPATRRRAARTSPRCTGTWSATCASGGEIYADGELIYRDGRFLPEFAPDLTPPAE